MRRVVEIIKFDRQNGEAPLILRDGMGIKYPFQIWSHTYQLQYVVQGISLKHKINN